MRSPLIARLQEFADLLATCGWLVQAAWIRDRVVVLQSGDADQARTAVLEIQSKMAGMGSLSDLSLEPPASSGLSRDEARKLQWDLLDAIDDELVFSTPGSDLPMRDAPD